MAQKDSTVMAGTLNAMEVTGDYGTTWTSNNAPGTFVRNILVRDSMIFITAPSVYRSSDNGATWQSQNNGIARPSQVWSLAQNDSLLILGTSGSFAGDTASIYISSDNGDSWLKVFSLGTFDVLYSFAVLKDEVFVGVLPSGVFYSCDKGVTWTNKNTALAAKHIGLSDTNLLCGVTGGSGGIFLSSDKGATWTNTLPLYYGYAFATSGSLTFAGTSNGFYYSNDLGYSWINDNAGLPPVTGVISVCVADSFIFIGTTNAGIFRRHLEDMATGINSNSVHEPQISASPNPFSTEITITGTLPAGLISLSDMVGNKLYEQKSEASETKLQTDQLRPGLYLLKYSFGNHSVSFKLAKH